MRLVACELPFHLCELHLQWLGIDFGEHITRFHHLALLEKYVLQQAIDARFHGRYAQRSYRSQAVLHDIQVRCDRRGSQHGLHAVGIKPAEATAAATFTGATCRSTSATFARIGRVCCGLQVPPGTTGDRRENQQRDEHRAHPFWLPVPGTHYNVVALFHGLGLVMVGVGLRRAAVRRAAWAW